MKLRNYATQEEVHWTIEQVLEEINRDRSEEWIPFNESDWLEGLEFTIWEYIE